MADLQILTNTLDVYLNQFSAAHGRIVGPAIKLFFIFFNFELIGFAFLVSQGMLSLSSSIKKLFWTGFWLWIITCWPELQKVLRESAVWLGLLAADSNKNIMDIFNPSSIAAYGLELSQPMTVWIRQLTLTNAVLSLDTILMSSIAALIVIGSFFWLALQIFVLLIEFYFASMMFSFMMAFRVFGITKWVSQGAAQMPLQYGAKIFTLTFFIGIAEPLIEDLCRIDPNTTLTFYDTCSIVIGSLAFAMLSLKLSSAAGALISGTPSLGAGDLAAATGTATGATLATGYLGTTAAKSAGSAAVTTAKTATNMTSAAATGATLGFNSGGSFASQAARGIAGAVKGAAAASPPANYAKNAMGSIANGFKNAVQSGRISGFRGTGGTATPSMQASVSNKNNAANMGQGFSKAYRSSQAMHRMGNSVRENHSGFNQGGKPRL